jgi:hypothetical protein
VFGLHFLRNLCCSDFFFFLWGVSFVHFLQIFVFL